MKATRTVIRGYLVPWGDLATWYDDYGRPDGTLETVRRGSFSESIQEVSELNPLPFDWHHDSAGLNGPVKIPIGVIVEAIEDRVGLLIKVLPHRSMDATDAVEAIGTRAVRGLSAIWRKSTAIYEPINRQSRRVLIKADLLSGCSTGMPMFKATRAWLETEEYDDGRPEPVDTITAAPAATGDSHV